MTENTNLIRIGEVVTNLDNVTNVSKRMKTNSIWIDTVAGQSSCIKETNPAYPEALRFWEWYKGQAKSFWGPKEKCERCANTQEGSDGMQVWNIGGNTLCAECHCAQDKTEADPTNKVDPAPPNQESDEYAVCPNCRSIVCAVDSDDDGVIISINCATCGEKWSRKPALQCPRCAHLGGVILCDDCLGKAAVIEFDRRNEVDPLDV